VNLTEKFLQFALLGANWVLWVLIALSIASVAIILERIFFYSGIAGKDSALASPLNAALADEDLDKARGLVKGAASPGARIVAALLASNLRTTTAMSALIDAARPAERLRLDRNLSFLGTVGANAPFIGLFGTVLEILRVFNLLGQQGVVSGAETQRIMTGISEALVATAIGLLVAIPAVIAYNALQRRVKSLLGEAEGLTQMALAQLSELTSQRGEQRTQGDD
jgi:biopolymer transport protein ExbB